MKNFNITKMLMALVMMKTWSDKESFSKWWETSKELQENKDEKSRKKYVENTNWVHKSFSVISDQMFGTISKNPVAVAKGFGGVKTEKGVNNLVTGWNGAMSQLLAQFQSMGAGYDVDAQWMQLFMMADMREGPMTGEVFEMCGLVKYEKIKEDQSIPFGSIGHDKTYKTQVCRGAGGFRFNRPWIERNGVFVANNAISHLRWGSMRLKANEAYALIKSAKDSIFGFDTSIIKTLNLASDQMLQALEGLGKYGVTAQSQLYFLTHPSNRSAVNTAIRAVAGENGTNPILEYNIQPIYSYKVDAINGNSKAFGYMVLPGQELIYSVYEDQMTDEKYDFCRDAVEIAGQEYFGFSAGKEAKTKQILEVELTA